MNIVVVCENNGHAALELIHKARLMHAQAHITALCEDGFDAMQACGGCGADDIACVDFCEDDCMQAQRIAAALETLSPDVALFPATIRGRFISAWAAAKLQTGLTADCTDLQLDEDGLLRQVRPAFSGNIIAEILCRQHRPQMASVRPGVFPLPDALPERPPIHKRTIATPSPVPMLRRLSFTPADNRGNPQDARIIVAGGKGLGSAKGFHKLERLANLLGGELGASRSAVDAGWISYRHQIGQTGIAVHPELYIAVGIHGAIQHIVGMKAAKTVIAINSDRNAPIFSYADYTIVGDWETNVDAIIKGLEQRA